LGLLQNKTYNFRTPQDALGVTKSLMQDFPELSDAEIAIWELMSNAVEHGILGISFEEKSALLDEDGVENEISKRLCADQYKNRSAFIEVKEFSDEYVLFVCDDGDGFDWKKFLDKKLVDVTGLHGRGIPISNSISKALTYIGNGNKVVVVFERTNI